MRTFIFPMLLLALLFANCKKSDPMVIDTETKTLLDPNEKGVALQVNNRSWFSDTTANAFFATRGGINPDELTLIAVGGFADQVILIDRITVFLSSVTNVGTLNLGGATNNSANFTTADATGNLLMYNTDSTHTGTITITEYDEPNNKISGVFDFAAVSSMGAIELKSGIFQDVPLRQ